MAENTEQHKNLTIPTKKQPGLLETVFWLSRTKYLSTSALRCRQVIFEWLEKEGVTKGGVIKPEVMETAKAYYEEHKSKSKKKDE